MTNMTNPRPGGLTALAVINFIFAGFGLLGAAGIASAMNNAEIRAAFDESVGHPVSDQWLALILALNVLVAALLLVSGIGYLGRKRVMGRVLGSVYGILGLASSAYEVSQRGMRIETMVGIVYPLLTL